MILTNEFWQGLEQYIKTNYRVYITKNEPEFLCEETAIYADIPKQKELTKNQASNLQHLLEEVGDSFHEKLFGFIDRNGMTDVEVYKKAGIDRRLFSKIRSNPAYHPAKNTVLALAIALELNIDETKDLLSRAEYALSPSNKGDLIVKFFIEHKVYDLMAINFALEEYGQAILG